LAGLAAAALDVEGEAPGPVAARLGLGQAGEPVADRREGAGVGRRGGARRAADRRLVDVDDLVEEVDAVDLVVIGGGLARAVHAPRQRLVERLNYQGRFAAARHAGDAREGAERDVDRDVLQVVAARAHDAEALIAVALAARQRQLDLLQAGEVLARD